MSSSNDLQTWTVVGHWENSRIQVEYVVDGDYEDPASIPATGKKGCLPPAGKAAPPKR